MCVCVCVCLCVCVCDYLHVNYYLYALVSVCETGTEALQAAVRQNMQSSVVAATVTCVLVPCFV